MKSYGDGVRSFMRWCEDNHHTSAVDRDLPAGQFAHGGSEHGKTFMLDSDELSGESGRFV